MVNSDYNSDNAMPKTIWICCDSRKDDCPHVIHIKSDYIDLYICAKKNNVEKDND